MLPTSHGHYSTSANIHSVLDVLEKQVSDLQTERDRADHEYQLAQRSLSRYKAACAQMHNSQAPIIAKLPIELLICIFLFVQNTVTASQVCRYWRAIALSCPRLWSSLHVHPSRGSKHLENLLTRSLGHTIDVCFCPVPLTLPKPPAFRSPIHQQLSLPPIYTQQYHPDMCLTPHVTSILTPHTSRFRSFELHAVVPGTWLTLLPLLARPAPALRTLHIYTTLPHDLAQLTLFANQTPQLRNVQITGAFPFSHHELLHNLTILRLESVPSVYRPTTGQLADILKACPDLVSLSLLDAGPIPDNGFGLRYEEERAADIKLPHLRALAFRDTDVNVSEALQGEGGMTWFSRHVQAPSLAALHIMLAPHPLAYTSRGGLPSPYSPIYANPTSPVTAAMKNKTTTVLSSVPTLEKLEELYLWAPHATGAEIEALLLRFPNLRTLEIPMVREPIQTLALFSSRKSDGPTDTRAEASFLEDMSHLDTDLTATDGYFSLEIPSSGHSISSIDIPTSITQRTHDEKRVEDDDDDSRWLCPKLERIGIPYINGCNQEVLEEALMDIFRVRNGSPTPSSDSLAKDINATPPPPVHRMTALLAPSGRPTYISEAVWQWIRLRASIQTMVSGQGGMEMLFDQISREVS